MRRTVLAASSLSVLAPLALLVLAGCSDATVEASGPTAEEVMAATERFRDVEVALAEGYIKDPMNICETADMVGESPDLGAMGVHYFRPELLGISEPPNPRISGTGTHTDFLEPGVLIYVPNADGVLELAAVENLVFRAAWEEAGNTTPPAFRGASYNLMEDDPATPVDEAHMFEPHYDLHYWLYRPNPRGEFAQFNPDVSCEYHEQQKQAAIPAPGQ